MGVKRTVFTRRKLVGEAIDDLWDCVANTHSAVTLIILGSATCPTRSFKHVHYWKNITLDVTTP
jgi:hypothetical protein